MLVEPLQTTDGFLLWLKSKEEREFAGFCGSPRLCPIANFLSTIIDVPSRHKVSAGAFVVTLSVDGVWLIEYEEYYPEWVVKFISSVDRFPNKTVYHDDYCVTVGDCLKILEEHSV